MVVQFTFLYLVVHLEGKEYEVLRRKRKLYSKDQNEPHFCFIFGVNRILPVKKRSCKIWWDLSNKRRNKILICKYFCLHVLGAFYQYNYQFSERTSSTACLLTYAAQSSWTLAALPRFEFIKNWNKPYEYDVLFIKFFPFFIVYSCSTVSHSNLYNVCFRPL